MALKLINDDPTVLFAHFGAGPVKDGQPLQLYAKVEEINGNKNIIRCGVSLRDLDGAYASSTFAEFIPDMNGPNFIAQAYEYLKTLPEFADAVDC